MLHSSCNRAKWISANECTRKQDRIYFGFLYYLMCGWCRLALVSPHGVAPSQMVSVSASVNLPLHDEVRSSFLAPVHPGGPGKRAIKRLWLWCGCGSLLSDDCMKTVFSPVCICYGHTCMPVSQQVNWVGHMPTNFLSVCCSWSVQPDKTDENFSYLLAPFHEVFLRCCIHVLFNITQLLYGVCSRQHCPYVPHAKTKTLYQSSSPDRLVPIRTVF